MKVGNVNVLMLWYMVLTFAVITNITIAYAQMDREKRDKINEIIVLKNEIINGGYTKEDIAFFPSLKLQTECESDSILYNKIQKLLQIDLYAITNYTELEDIYYFLGRVYSTLTDIKKYQELLQKKPPKVTLNELVIYHEYCRNKNENSELDIDSNKVIHFMRNIYFIQDAKGTQNYDLFLKMLKTDPYFEILLDFNNLDVEKNIKIAIIDTILEKIIDSDDRVKMLLFGYDVKPCINNLHIEVKEMYGKVEENQNDSISKEILVLFYSEKYRKFVDVFKEYSRKINEMNIGIEYTEREYRYFKMAMNLGK